MQIVKRPTTSPALPEAHGARWDPPKSAEGAGRGDSLATFHLSWSQRTGDLTT